MNIELNYKETNWDKAINAAIQRGLTRATIIVRNDAVKLCPVDKGRLSNSIKREVKDKEGKVYTNVDYAPVIEYGVKKAYKIKVKNKKVLSDGKVIYGKKVTHPAMKAKPFMRPALYNNRQKVIKVIKDEIQKVTRGKAGGK